jgi:prophage antirepressor-like protein
VSEIVPFAFNGAEVRTVLIDDKPWFIAADVAKILSYRDAANAVRTLRDRQKNSHPVSTPGGVQNLIVVSEPGLYRLVMRSDLPAAGEFQDWVTEEVLPAIRETGGYRARAKSDVPSIEDLERRKVIAQTVAAEFDALQSAIRLRTVKSDVAQEQGRALLALIGVHVPPPPPAPTPAEDVIRWTRQLGVGTEFSARDAWRVLKGRPWADVARTVHDVLADLAETGHLCRLPGPARRGSGRPPGPRYVVTSPVVDRPAVEGGTP